jgi:hypothetical protein
MRKSFDLCYGRGITTYEGRAGPRRCQTQSIPADRLPRGLGVSKLGRRPCHRTLKRPHCMPNTLPRRPAQRHVHPPPLLCWIIWKHRNGIVFDGQRPCLWASRLPREVLLVLWCIMFNIIATRCKIQTPFVVNFVVKRKKNSSGTGFVTSIVAN